MGTPVWPAPDGRPRWPPQVTAAAAFIAATVAGMVREKFRRGFCLWARCSRVRFLQLVSKIASRPRGGVGGLRVHDYYVRRKRRSLEPRGRGRQRVSTEETNAWASGAEITV